ncbi:hypothetical protein WMY93_008501 [Mugilogobius chulae]|uniref:Trafficking protein, kinesin binding 2 n=1 Tax=Mugilogobius chulae TaxID=88201 RepID=A0AAW0PGD9_9GOBI
MYEAKQHRAVEKKESSTETDEGLGSSSKHFGSGSLGSGSGGPCTCPTARTGPYNDIEVVTHLLAERDRDLELAARIGQSLLQRNHLLQERNDAIEEQLAQALDQETDSSVSTPLRQNPPLGAVSTATAALSQLEHLQSKLQELEEENLALRSEACQLKRDTISYEEKEQQLVSDCVKELRKSIQNAFTHLYILYSGNISHFVIVILGEFVQKEPGACQHQEEIAQLLSQIVELQHRVKELALEKEELRIHLQASKDSQRQLTAEDSLAAEIEGTMRRELSLDEETAYEDQRVSQKRVFQTVRSLNAAATSRAFSATPPIPGSGSSLVMTSQPFPSTLSLRRHNFLCERQFFQAERDKKLQRCSSPMGSVMSSYSNLTELSFGSSVFKTFLPEKLQIVKPMEGSLTLHHWQQLAKPHLATILDPHPGIVTKGFRPLAQDTVYQLSDMEEDEDNQRRNFLEKGQQNRAKKKTRRRKEREEAVGLSTSCPAPFPESALNTDNCHDEHRVNVRAENQSAQSISGTATTTSQSNDKTVVTASSVQNPGKSQSSTFSTYTFTTCRILHPSDVTQVTPSSQSSLATPPAQCGPAQHSGDPLQTQLGRLFPPRRPVAPAAGSLAKLVLERGISAQVSTETPPSPKPKNRPPLLRLFPVTPLNSPSQSPAPSPAPTERPADNFLASRPAELFLQDVYGLNLGRAPHPNLPSPSQETQPQIPQPKPADQVGIVERLRKLGFKKVLQSESARQDSTFVSAGGGSLLDGLRRNQSLPALIGAKAGKSQSHPPPQHPTSLAIPPPAWGNLKEKRRHVVSRPVPTTKS